MTANIETNNKKNFYPKCDKKYCRNEGTLFPILTMPAPKFTRQKTIEIEIDLNVCVQHSEITPIGDYMDDEGFADIIKSFTLRRFTLPKREEITVIFRALEDRKNI